MQYFKQRRGRVVWLQRQRSKIDKCVKKHQLQCLSCFLCHCEMKMIPNSSFAPSFTLYGRCGEGDGVAIILAKTRPTDAGARGGSGSRPQSARTRRRSEANTTEMSALSSDRSLAEKRTERRGASCSKLGVFSVLSNQRGMRGSAWPRRRRSELSKSGR